MGLTTYSAVVAKLHHYAHPSYTFPPDQAIPLDDSGFEEYARSLAYLAIIIAAVSCLIVITLLIRW